MSDAGNFIFVTLTGILTIDGIMQELLLFIHQARACRYDSALAEVACKRIA